MLKNLKSIFIIEDETPKKAKATAPKAKATPASTSTPKPKVEAARAGKITPKFTDILLGAMDKANLDGFDYLEYKKSLQSLTKMNMDEATAYQSAFAMAQTMGATPAKLIQSAQHYIGILKQEEEKFEGALANQQKSKIGSKQQEQKQLQQTIKDKEEQIKRLQAEIQQHQKQLSKLDEEINSAVSSIGNTKNDFFASYQHLVSQIEADVKKMQQHLK